VVGVGARLYKQLYDERLVLGSEDERGIAFVVLCIYLDEYSSNGCTMYLQQIAERAGTW
jgi:hypothetical protein